MAPPMSWLEVSMGGSDGECEWIGDWGVLTALVMPEGDRGDRGDLDEFEVGVGVVVARC